MTWEELEQHIARMSDEEKQQPVRFLDENELDDEPQWDDARKDAYCDTVANELDNISSFIGIEGIRLYVLTP